MTRAEKRRLERESQKLNKTYMMSREQIDIFKNEMSKEVLIKSYLCMCAIPLLNLKKNYGFGKKRLEKFLDEVLEGFHLQGNNFRTIDDIVNTLYVETGVKINLENMRKNV